MSFTLKIAYFICMNFDLVTDIHTIPIIVHGNDYPSQKRQKYNFLKSAYFSMDGMWLVFANEKHFIEYMKCYKCHLVYNWYVKAKNIFDIKNYGMQGAIWKIW